MNHEILEWIDYEDLVREIKTQRIIWYGRREVKPYNKNMLDATRKNARETATLRWKEQVKDDPRRMEVKDRIEWRKIVEVEAKTRQKQK